MISKELYNLAIEADKKAAKNVCGCNTCFCELIKENIEKSINLNRAFLTGRWKNDVYTICSSVLFYLQDLGIIKILQGVANRNSGVDCNNLEIKVLHPSEGNKIWKLKNFIKYP